MKYVLVICSVFSCHQHGWFMTKTDCEKAAKFMERKMSVSAVCENREPNIFERLFQ